MSDKITPERLERPAIVYVRQSSQHQLLHNTESARLQYAMAERVRALGWKEIEIVDEDQGRSAATTSGRTGFQRMVAEVALGKSGAVAAIEVSRFARNNRDWHQLIEMCGMVDTRRHRGPGPCVHRRRARAPCPDDARCARPARGPRLRVRRASRRAARDRAA